MMKSAEYLRAAGVGHQNGMPTAPNTGMAPHPIVQQGPTMPTPGRPVMGVNTGEIGTPWAQRFSR